MAQIIDGKGIAAQIRSEVKAKVERMKQSQGSSPGLTVVIVGEDPASTIYVRNKVRACEECGIRSDVVRLPADVSQKNLLGTICELNQSDGVHGILVQLPLPHHLDEMAVIEAIDSKKDVDGFTLQNAGSLFVGREALRPCTPQGCMELIESTGLVVSGKRVAVVGRSHIVGKPVAMMLLEKNATVTLCHSKTIDLADILRESELVVAAMGRPRAISGDMLKPGAVLIDVGINRLDDGSLCGDFDFDSAEKVASWITPVPGGVGPMTIAVLMKNTLEAAQRQLVDKNKQ